MRAQCAATVLHRATSFVWTWQDAYYTTRMLQLGTHRHRSTLAFPVCCGGPCMHVCTPRRGRLGKIGVLSSPCGKAHPEFRTGRLAQCPASVGRRAGPSPKAPWARIVTHACRQHGHGHAYAGFLYIFDRLLLIHLPLFEMRVILLDGWDDM